MVFTIIIIILGTADQLTKALVNRNLGAADRIIVIDGFFYLINRKNSGAAWSFLAAPDWGIYLLIAISLAVTLVLLYTLYRSRHKWLRISLALICAGSIGNLIDRIRYREVTDFLDFHFGSYIFPTFNLADILIVCGTILLGIIVIKDHEILEKSFWPVAKKEDKHNADNTAG